LAFAQPPDTTELLLRTAVGNLWNYEGGIDWTPSSRWRGDLTVFERRERDDIDYYRPSPSHLWQAVNIDALNFCRCVERCAVCGNEFAESRFPILVALG
jgi:hypothetical protein